MKKLILLLTFTQLIFFSYAQDCLNTEFLKEGTKWEVSNYNKKGKLTGLTKYETVSENKSGGNYIWELKFKSFDKKGEESMPESLTTITCENGVFKIDMTEFVPAETMEGFKDMEVEMKTSNLYFPNNYNDASKLEDGTINITTFASGVQIMSMDMTIKDRIIEGIETIETSAGSFKCLKINQNTLVEMGFINRETSSTSWFLPGFGVVKSETFKSNGDSMGTSVLTSMTKP